MQKPYENKFMDVMRKATMNSCEIEQKLATLIDRLKPGFRVTVLTGAGISAESGIPTFRGPEGFWTVGSREYHPQEMATFTMFKHHPREVWNWYLYRRGICRKALPNAAHQALVRLERGFNDRFLLITQNVDGLHLSAGSNLLRTYQIHGNIDYMRCSIDCSDSIYPVPPELFHTKKAVLLSDQEYSALICPRCMRATRPHVLWFDECYDETHYKFESSIYAARITDLLIVVGTSAQTNLPLQIGYSVTMKGGVIIDVNPETNTFSHLAQQGAGGHFLKGTACEYIPPLIDFLLKIDQNLS